MAVDAEIEAGLITHGLYMESFPVQLRIKLSFTDEDNCEALVKDDFCFSISNLAQHYEQNYQTDTGTIIIRLDNYDGALEYTF